MKVRAYVLILSVAFLGMSAGTRKAKFTEGLNPGDLAPRIEFFGNENSSSFHRQSGGYTLLNFWAAYDAESRVRNAQLANEVSKYGSDRVIMRSISFDESKSIFNETVRIDNLDSSSQFHEELGSKSELYKKFSLDKGFKSILINDDGVIVATNISPEKLSEIIGEV